MACLSGAAGVFEIPTGVTGKECVLFAAGEENTLVREKGRELEGLSCWSFEESAPGRSRLAISPSEIGFFVLKLR